MSGFKLLAIRPLEGCKSRFLKNLKPNQIYQFYNDYKFIMNDDFVNIDKIEYSSSYPENFFYVDRYVDDIKTKKSILKPIKVNISAIVGKNGSGKSALSELLLYSFFVISRNLDFIEKESFLDLESDVIEDNIENDRYEKDVLEISEGLKVEVFYRAENVIYIMQINKGEVRVKKTILESNIFNISENEYKSMTVKSLFPDFYTMVVNYSFYGFNSNQIGMWIKAFFHKNDGYQMPVVINPYRDKGIMDVNTENYLTSSRLLANILSIEDYKNINPKSSIDKIELYLDERKNYKYLENGELRFTDKFKSQFRENIIEPLFKLTFKGEIEYPQNDSNLFSHAEIYLIQKLITIPTKYSVFSDYNKRKRKKDSQDNYRIIKRDSPLFVKDLHEDKSHITLKVRQTLNFLRENIFSSNSSETKTVLNLNEILKSINDNYKEKWFTDLIDYLPPPFYVNKIRFKDGSYFSRMSSGEKQKIYSLNSIIYHLKNIDSVHKNSRKNKEKDIKVYDTINLVLDEIELYYHPDSQKDIINNLLKFIEDAKYNYINHINIIFLTHSPFVLSDIPHQNILKLEAGIVKKFNNIDKTFGANIHNLLANDFYLNDGFMGEFAKTKIGNIVTFLNYHLIEKRIQNLNKKNEKVEIEFLKKEKIRLKGRIHVFDKAHHKEIINLIGEPIIKNKLLQMYDEAFEVENRKDIKEDIIRLALNAGLDINFNN